MLIFKKLRMKNILSIGNTFQEIDLNTHRHTLITGVSGNGKSTIIDAISFALYGKVYRNIKKGQIINSINKKKMVVELEFNNYKVIRGIAPDIFEIYKDDVLIPQGDNKKDYQDKLEKEILKMNYKTFTQTIIMGSAAFTPFMQLTAGHRREVVENVFDVEIFSKMQKLAKKKFDDYKKMSEELSFKIDTIKKTIASFNEILEKQIKVSEDEIASLREKKALEKENYDIKSKELEKLKSELKALREIKYNFTSDEINNAIDTYRKKLAGLDTEIKYKKKELDFLEHNDTCTTCKQDIPEAYKAKNKEKIESEISSLLKKQEKAKNIADDLLSKKKEFASTQDNILKLVSEVKYTNMQLKTIASNAEMIINKIKELKERELSEDFNVTKKKLAELKSEIKEYNTSYNDAAKQVKNIKVCIDILKDDGIKTVIIGKYIPILNSLINKYLEQLDMFVLFELDSEFNEVIKSRFRDEFSYYSFSEGEKKRIDFSILLAFRELSSIKNNMSSNLLIIDELLDGLNEELINNVEDILTSSQDSNTIIISHNEDIKNREMFDRLIQVQKRNNFTEYEVT